MATVQPELDLNFDGVTSTPERFVCPDCPDRGPFKNKHALTMHRVTKHEGRGYIAKKNAGLIKPTKKKMAHFPKSKPKQFLCPRCPRTFVSRTGLGSHMRTHGIKGSSKTARAAAAAKKAAAKKPPTSTSLVATKVAVVKRGRPSGTAKSKGYCVLCKKTYKGVAGLAIHTAQTHNKHNHDNHDGGKPIYASSQLKTSSHFDEEINTAFVAGALVERILIQGTGLLAELVAGRIAAATAALRMGASKVR